MVFSTGCPREEGYLLIIIGVILGIVAIGAALLLIWKLLATIQVNYRTCKLCQKGMVVLDRVVIISGILYQKKSYYPIYFHRHIMRIFCPTEKSPNPIERHVMFSPFACKFHNHNYSKSN